MYFTDMHNHALFGVDDGAKTKEEMFAMLDRAYADGVRQLCLTPHYHLGYFGHNSQRTAEAFAMAREYVREKYPDLQLFRGNELRYSGGCVQWLADGQCHTLADTPFVLVDFSFGDSERCISEGLFNLQGMGYVPVFAHPERYSTLKPHHIRDYMDRGVLIQIDAGSLMGKHGLGTKLRSRKMLKKGLVDMIGTDAHDGKDRCPSLSEIFRYIEKKYDREYAEVLCCGAATAVLAGLDVRDQTM